MVIALLDALALAHCIVGAAARIPCNPMATTNVILHWGPSYAGGAREGGCQEDGRVASVGSMLGRGRAGSVQVLELRALLRGSAAVGCTITGATCSVQLLVEVCTHCPLGSLP